VNGEKKENQESREVQICVRMKGIINTHFGDRRPFAFGSREKGKLDRRGRKVSSATRRLRRRVLSCFYHWHDREWILHLKTEAWRPVDGFSGLQ